MNIVAYSEDKPNRTSSTDYDRRHIRDVISTSLHTFSIRHGNCVSILGWLRYQMRHRLGNWKLN